jgi:hypothetical protein
MSELLGWFLWGVLVRESVCERRPVRPSRWYSQLSYFSFLHFNRFSSNEPMFSTVQDFFVKLLGTGYIALNHSALMLQVNRGSSRVCLTLFWAVVVTSSLVSSYTDARATPATQGPPHPSLNCHCSSAGGRRDSLCQVTT